MGSGQDAARIMRWMRAYFRAAIAPLFNQTGVEYVGEINERAKSGFLGEASALLFPVDWPKPFGLSMIEAMALVSYRINRQLSVWILPPLMIRAFGAHCHFRTHAVQHKTDRRGHLAALE
jgi:hypothetical protein